MAHKKYPKFTTGRGTAVGFVTLNNPDTKFKQEGEYSVGIAFDEDDDVLQEISDACDELAQEKFDEITAELIEKGKKAVAKKVKIISLIRDEEDEESGEPTGRKIIKPKMKASGVNKKTGKGWKRKPDIFNAKGKILSNPPLIYAGTVMKASIELFPYYTAKDKEVGVTFRLNGVQLLELVSGGGQRSASDHGFGEEEGDDIEDQEFDDQSQDADDGDDDEDDDL